MAAWKVLTENMSNNMEAVNSSLMKQDDWLQLILSGKQAVVKLDKLRLSPRSQKKIRSSDNKEVETERNNHLIRDTQTSPVKVKDGVPPGQWRTFLPTEALSYLGILDDELPTPNLETMEIDTLNSLKLTCVKLRSKFENYFTQPQHFSVLVTNASCKDEFMSYLDLDSIKPYGTSDDDDGNLRTIIFCNEIDKVETLSTKLRQQQLLPQVIHENVAYNDCQAIMSSFKDGCFCRLLICTDFLHEISLDSANLVVNIDLPQTKSIYTKRAAFVTRVAAESPEQNSLAVINMIQKEDFKQLRELEADLGFRIEAINEDSAQF